MLFHVLYIQWLHCGKLKKIYTNHTDFMSESAKAIMLVYKIQSDF